MKRILFIFALTTVMGIGKSTANFFNDADAFFHKYVKNGRVAYSEIKSNPSELNNLLEQIGSFDLNSANDATKKAFMINAYNILAISGIIDKYPVKSPMKVSNFFDNKKHTVAGTKMSLNQLEKSKLYPWAKDSRLHFVLVCAAVSCPKLASFAYKPENLEAQIEKVTKSTLNDPEFIRVSGKKVELSEIFNWYGSDFKEGGKTVISYINQYRTSKLETKGLRFYTYNWNLNDKK